MEEVILTLQGLVQDNSIERSLRMILKENILHLVFRDHQTLINKLLARELLNFINYEKRTRKRKKVKANFTLIDRILLDDERNGGNLIEYLEICRPLGRRFTIREKRRALDSYLVKKRKRKDSNYIRYRVRKELACKRLRHKGKFIKKPKIDLKEMALEFEKKSCHL